MLVTAMSRRVFARVVIFAVCLAALATLPARADDPLATFFAQAFAQPLPPQPGIIKPLRRAMRERAQGTLQKAQTTLARPAPSWSRRSTALAKQLSSHTASGERFNRFGMTAAHKTWPFGTRVLVCLVACATVRINDRGPFVRGRSLDLAYGAARAIGLRGTASVRVAII